ncbi:MAG: DUF58 domain-containing protein [Planctomycetes bacterium]|nr:DUF58 domain-containing protein [Planctomycetota bacterium]
MTVPGRPVFFAAVFLALVLAGAAAEPVLLWAGLAGDALIVAFCLLEGRWLARYPLQVSREGWNRCQLNREADFVFRIENRGSRSMAVFIRQPWPASFEARENSAEVEARPGESVLVALSAIPRRRGRIAIPATEISLRSRAGLAVRRWSVGGEAALSVYPNLRSLYEYDVLRRHHALRQVGIHRMRMVGAGREFEQMREYLPDDDFRDINWKATARCRRPITNVYQAERSQDLILCLDCGRMMGNPVGSGTALDRAVDASIMLAHVASRQGDRVGLALFRESVQLFLKPKAGALAIHRIIEELVEVTAAGVFPSYAALINALRAKHKRRSMVFLFTDLNDPQLAANMAEVLPLVSRRHVLVAVSLRDALLDRIASGPAADTRDLYRVLAARQLASERDARARELAQRGVQVLEVDANSISMEVINKYLEIKMRQLV